MKKQSSNTSKVRRSLGVKLNLANFALTIMVCLMVTISYYKILSNRIEEQAKAEIVDVISTLQLSLEARAGKADLQRVVGAMAAKPSIRRMSILSGDTVVADSSGKFVGSSREYAFNREVSNFLDGTQQKDKDYFITLEPGLIHQSHLLYLISDDVQRLRPYLVYVAYNTLPMEEQAKAELIEFMIIQLVGFLLILLINPLVQREVVLKPIRTIREQISHNPRATIDFASNDEFGLMIDSYNNAIRQRQLGEQDLIKSRHYIDKVTNVIPVQLAYVDRDLKFRFVNRRLLQWLGKPEADVLGREVAEVVPPEMEVLFRPHINRALQGRVQVFESEADLPDGDAAFLQSTYVPDIDEQQEVKGFFMCVEDMTHIKANEHKIEVYAQEMEFKNWALTEATEKAQEATRIKTDFLACMSHEIRTPMNGVLGVLSLLEQTELSQQQQQYVAVASSSADALLSLLNDILDFTKVESGKFTIEETDFDVIQLLDDVIQPLAMKSEQKGLQLNLDLRGVEYRYIQGDPTRIRQILSNLIGNAIKFTEEGWVKVTVSVSEYDGDLRLRAEVEDTGIGIDVKKQPLLFQPFVQADSSTTRHFGGTGLGLSIARRLCQLMSGDVRVQSQVGKGSVFAFHIKAEKVTNDGAEFWPPMLQGKDILLVREQALDDEQVRGLLNAWGAETKTSDFDVLNDIDSLPQNVICSVPKSTEDASALLERLAMIAANGHNVMAVMSHNQLLKGTERFANQIHLSTRPVQVQMLEACLDGKLTVTTESETSISQFDNKYRILLVEDSKVNQIVISGMLKKLGLEQVLIVENGEKALVVMASTEFDLIMMDCQMPVMDGFHATEAIRDGKAGSNNQGIPILALTANAMAGDREKCLASGMNDYIVKPVTIHALDHALSNFLEVSGRGKTEFPLLPEKSLETQKSVLDMDAILGTFMGDRELLVETLTAFAEEMVEHASALSILVDTGDFDAIGECSHTIKGAASNLAMVPLATVSRELEMAAKSGDTKQVLRLHEQFSLLFDATIMRVRDVLAREARLPPDRLNGVNQTER